MRPPKTVVLRPEYDDALRAAVVAAVRELGGELLSQTSGVAGSQDLAIATVRVGGALVTIEAETYVGISISGDAAVVDALADRLRRPAYPRRS